MAAVIGAKGLEDLFTYLFFVGGGGGNLGRFLLAAAAHRPAHLISESARNRAVRPEISLNFINLKCTLPPRC